LAIDENRRKLGIQTAAAIIPNLVTMAVAQYVDLE
jgi:hypothetical protein